MANPACESRGEFLRLISKPTAHGSVSQIGVTSDADLLAPPRTRRCARTDQRLRSGTVLFDRGISRIISEFLLLHRDRLCHELRNSIGSAIADAPPADADCAATGWMRRVLPPIEAIALRQTRSLRRPQLGSRRTLAMSGSCNRPNWSAAVARFSVLLRRAGMPITRYFRAARWQWQECCIFWKLLSPGGYAPITRSAFWRILRDDRDPCSVSFVAACDRKRARGSYPTDRTCSATGNS
jgi:hypothetical protein